MGAGHVSKDSWSRCDTPSMLYDATRKPTVPKVNLEALSSANGKDTLESPRQRLKNEALNKLDSKGLQLPHESYVAVVQVGKYIFMAVMLPVYLSCYTIPRWFAVNALTPLFEGVKNQSMNVGRHIVEMSKHVTDLMKGLLEQLIGDAMKMSKERGRNLWRHVSRRLHRVAKKLSGFSNFIKTNVGKVKEKIGDASKKVMEQAHYQSKSTNQWIAQKAVKIGKKVEAKASSYFQRFDKAFLSPFMNMVVAPFKFIAKIARSVKKRVIAVLKIVKRRFDRMCRPIVEIVTKAVEFVTGKIKGYAQVFFEYFRKKMGAVSDFAVAVKKAVLRPVVRFLERLWIFGPVFRFARKGLGVAFLGSKAAYKFTRKLLPKKLVKRVLVHLGSPIKKGMKSSFGIVTKRISKGKAVAVGSFKFSRRLSRYVLWVFKFLGRAVMRFLGGFLNVLGGVATRVAFVGHVVIAVLWLSTKHGFQLTKQVGSVSVSASQEI